MQEVTYIGIHSSMVLQEEKIIIKPNLMIFLFLLSFFVFLFMHFNHKAIPKNKFYPKSMYVNLWVTILK